MGGPGMPPGSGSMGGSPGGMPAGGSPGGFRMSSNISIPGSGRQGQSISTIKSY